MDLLHESMDFKPLTSEQIALNEKKMNMTLDDIIKMNKKATLNHRKSSALNKRQKFPNRSAARGNFSNVRQFLDSRASVRQGVLAQRRSNFQSNQFCLATAIARKAAAALTHSRHLNRNRMVNWSQPRVGTSPIQRKSIEGSFSNKQRQVKVVSKQWGPRSSGSLFANMNEQRMKIVSQQNNINNTWHAQRRGGHQHQQRGRGQFSNGRGQFSIGRGQFSIGRGKFSNGRGQFSNWAYKSIRRTFSVIV